MKKKRSNTIFWRVMFAVKFVCRCLARFLLFVGFLTVVVAGIYLVFGNGGSTVNEIVVVESEGGGLVLNAATKIVFLVVGLGVAVVLTVYMFYLIDKYTKMVLEFLATVFGVSLRVVEVVMSFAVWILAAGAVMFFDVRNVEHVRAVGLVCGILLVTTAGLFLLAGFMEHNERRRKNGRKSKK